MIQVKSRFGLLVGGLMLIASFVRADQPVSLSCHFAGQSDSVIRDVFVTGEMYDTGKLVIYFNNQSAWGMKVRLSPANSNGTGIMAVVIDRSDHNWVLDFVYDETAQTAVLNPTDTHAAPVAFKCPRQ